MSALAAAKTPQYDSLQGLVDAFVDQSKPDRAKVILDINVYFAAHPETYDQFAKELLDKAINELVGDAFRTLNNQITSSAEIKYLAMTQKQTKPPANAPTTQNLKDIVKGTQLLEYNMMCKKILGDCTKMEVAAEADMYKKNYIGNLRKYNWFSTIQAEMASAGDTATVKEVLSEDRLRALFKESEDSVK